MTMKIMINLEKSHNSHWFHEIFFAVSRLEEKEADNKKEYTKLHERYSELFKTHLDYMEKTKSVLGAEKLEQMQQGFGASRPRIAGMALNQLNRSSGPVSFGYAELENNNAQQASILTDFASQTTPGVDRSNVSLKNELKSPLDLNKSPSKRKKIIILFIRGSFHLYNVISRNENPLCCSRSWGLDYHF